MDTQAARAGRRARVEDSFAREDDFGVALILILFTIVFFAAAEGAVGQIVSVVISSATLLFVLHTAGARKRVFRIVALVVIVAVVGTIVTVIVGDGTMGRSATSLVGLLLAVVAPLVILRRIVQAHTITVRLVLGALSIYLLFGLAYSYLFPLVAIVTGEPYFVQTKSPASIDYAYFSYTTLATVGYGDFTAATSIGRMISISEALVGQLFLVSAVALLVGNIGRTLRPAQASEASGASQASEAAAAPVVDRPAATGETVIPPGR
ncbi:MAG: potassium channel family protein [Chloroflexota bacterium]